jgi:hypothetical protein
MPLSIISDRLFVTLRCGLGDSVSITRRDWRIGIAADADGTLAAHVLLRPRIDIAVKLALRTPVRRVVGDMLLLVSHRPALWLRSMLTLY